MNKSWLGNNAEYWSNIASKYNQLYEDNWSGMEDKFIQKKLIYLRELKYPKVLDLGCGTGLGYKLCKAINPNIVYCGVDFSSEMLAILKSDYPEAQIYNTSMSDLTNFKPQSFDIVISIFTSFSYTDNVIKTIEELTRVLKPNGQVLISILSKYSLRRLINFKWGSKERYRTKGMQSRSFSFAWVFDNKNFKRLFNDSFKDIDIKGYNVFGGTSYFSNFPSLWKLNLFLSRNFPNLSHELILTARKK